MDSAISWILSKLSIDIPNCMCVYFLFFPLESQMKEQTFKLSGDKSVLKVVVKCNKKEM